jgi:uncharacterized protein with PQ loop repeat
VFEASNPLNFILFLNSFFIIGFILNQNESAKDSVTTQSSSAGSNPLEKLTWISLILQLSLLLIKIKTNDF